jgi:long-chain acyl-CoA synthetase
MLVWYWTSIARSNTFADQFDPLTVLQAIDKYKVNEWYSAVPMNFAVMAHPDAGSMT